MERNRKEARLRVDQNSPIIRAESSQGHRALSLGDNPLYVGSDKDYRVRACVVSFFPWLENGASLSS